MNRILLLSLGLFLMLATTSCFKVDDPAPASNSPNPSTVDSTVFGSVTVGAVSYRLNQLLIGTAGGYDFSNEYLPSSGNRLNVGLALATVPTTSTELTLTDATAGRLRFSQTTPNGNTYLNFGAVGEKVVVTVSGSTLVFTFNNLTQCDAQGRVINASLKLSGYISNAKN